MSLRDELLDTAIERFAEHGPGTSFDAIAADVGVTKGALYHHFGSKDGLVEEVYKEAIRRHAARVMEASAAGDGRTRLLALVDASARPPPPPRRGGPAPPPLRLAHPVLPTAHHAASRGRNQPPPPRGHRAA